MSGLKKDRRISAIYDAIFMIIRMATVLIIVFLSKIPYAQIILVQKVMLFNLAYFIESWPFKENLMNKKEVFNLVCIILYVYTLSTIHNSAISDTLKGYLGNAVIGICSITIVISMIIVVIEKVYYGFQDLIDMRERNKIKNNLMN